MKSVKLVGILSSLLITFSSLAAFAEPREVDHLIKCHEGKFTLHDAIHQLNQNLADARGAVYSSAGVPGSVAQVEDIMVKAPFTVSAPMVFMNNDNGSAGPTPYACVTISKVK